MDWSAKSPDLNPIENVWKLISSIVFDNRQYDSTRELMSAVNNAVNDLNNENRQKVHHLISNMNQRLVEVVKDKGGLTKF